MESQNTYLEDLIQKYDHFLLDLDGVVYSGGKLIDGSKEAIELIQKYTKDGLKFLYFLTNSSGNTPSRIKDRLSKLGLEVEQKECFR